MWWPCSSLKVTTASQTWQILNLYYNTLIAISRTAFKVWHSNSLCELIYYTQKFIVCMWADCFKPKFSVWADLILYAEVNCNNNNDNIFFKSMMIITDNNNNHNHNNNIKKQLIKITLLTGALISIFPNQFKAPQGWSFGACCQWALLYVQIISLLFI